MTQIAEGTTFVGAGLADLDARFKERGHAIQMLFRDARGAATDISPHNPDGSIKFSPITADQKLRGDLCAVRRVEGQWITNPESNEGWYPGNAFKDKEGPSSEPVMRSDKLMIVQSDFPYDTTTIEQGEKFSATPIDTALPWVRRLRNNQRLVDADGNSLVEDPGQLNAGWGRAIGGRNIGRQFLLIRELDVEGLPMYKVDGYALAKLETMGGSKQDKVETEATKFTWEPTPDGYFSAVIDGVYQEILRWTWVGGAGWVALGGAPLLSLDPPTATATTAGKANIVFPNPAGAGDPWAFAPEKSTDDGATWSAATKDGEATSTGGNTTVKVTGVAAGATKFRVKVTGTNGASAYTPKSNAATITS